MIQCKATSSAWKDCEIPERDSNTMLSESVRAQKLFLSTLHTLQMNLSISCVDPPRCSTENWTLSRRLSRNASQTEPALETKQGPSRDCARGRPAPLQRADGPQKEAACGAGLCLFGLRATGAALVHGAEPPWRGCASAPVAVLLREDDGARPKQPPGSLRLAVAAAAAARRIDLPDMGGALKFKSNFDNWDDHPTPNFGTFLAVGITMFVLFVVTIILCFTCSCCCLYKACRRQPRPIVTTTTATTVVQVPYPQQPGVPPGYPVGAYQGYNPVPVQPQHGMPAAPYPTQYPPPYPTQPAGPPAYHETMAGAGAPVTQPPYNPAYMDPPKSAY
ncbi:hypothetical protein lerEdw1_015774 [Lerista edwardsae]|nr:hypothetical protein lerEdw1_015774 [Lerista edwardsae]